MLAVELTAGLCVEDEMALDALRLAGILEHQAQYDGQTDYKHSAAASLRSMHAEIEQLRLAEEGAKEAFGHVVQQKRELEAECKRLRGLLDGAYDTIRRNAATHNFDIGRSFDA